MDPALLITAAVTALGTAIGLTLAALTLRQMRRDLRALAERIGGTVKSGSVRVVVDGREVRCGQRHRRHGASFMELLIPAHVPFDFEVRPRDLGDDIVAALSLQEPHLTGDDRFNQRFVVLSYHQEGIASLALDPDWRSAVSAVFAHGCSHFRANGRDGNHQVLWDPLSRYPEDSPTAIPETVRAAMDVERFTASRPADPAHIDDGSRDHTFLWLIGINITLLGLGGFAAMIGYVEYEPLEHDRLLWLLALVSIPAWLILNRFNFDWSRRHLQRHVHFLNILWVSALGIPTGVLAALLITNGALDDLPPTRVIYDVREKYRERADGTFHHYLELRRSDDPTSVRDRRVRRSVWYDTTPGRDRVGISDHPGYLGIPWSNERDVRVLAEGEDG